MVIVVAEGVGQDHIAKCMVAASPAYARRTALASRLPPYRPIPLALLDQNLGVYLLTLVA